MLSPHAEEICVSGLKRHSNACTETILWLNKKVLNGGGEAKCCIVQTVAKYVSKQIRKCGKGRDMERAFDIC